ncbi:response regulator [Sphingobium sp.]|uniref:response regulator n=1 Tax=Sphingobium sp. TaxID=1912891 RepID=UPI003BB5D315
MTRIDILYVDDDDDIRTIVELALGIDGDVRVRAMSTAQAALDLLTTWSPDVILLDVMMPGIDGPTMLAKVRERPQLARIPVIFMTAKGRESDVERYLTMGAIGVIRKPFDPLRLAGDIRNILGNP